MVADGRLALLAAPGERRGEINVSDWAFRMQAYRDDNRRTVTEALRQAVVAP